MMNNRIKYATSKISRMSKRRQKVALRRWLEKDLQRFVGESTSPFVRAEVTRVILSKLGVDIYADVTLQPIVPIKHINATVPI
jgi:hypothetical protein